MREIWWNKSYLPYGNCLKLWTPDFWQKGTGRQCRPWSGYSWRRSLIRVYMLWRSRCQFMNQRSGLVGSACGQVSASNQSLRFILSLRLYSSFITSRPASWKEVHWCGWCPCICTLIKNQIMMMTMIKDLKINTLDWYESHHHRSN